MIQGRGKEGDREARRQGGKEARRQREKRDIGVKSHDNLDLALYGYCECAYCAVCKGGS